MIVRDTAGRISFGRWDLVVQGLIILNLAAFAVETLPNLSAEWRKGLGYFESPAQPEKFASVFHSLWWAIVTLTTVGYGDVYPITLGGRIFTGLVLVVGVGTVAIPSGLFASALTKAREDMAAEDETRREGP